MTSVPRRSGGHSLVVRRRSSLGSSANDKTSPNPASDNHKKLNQKDLTDVENHNLSVSYSKGISLYNNRCTCTARAKYSPWNIKYRSLVCFMSIGWTLPRSNSGKGTPEAHIGWTHSLRLLFRSSSFLRLDMMS